MTHVLKLTSTFCIFLLFITVTLPADGRELDDVLSGFDSESNEQEKPAGGEFDDVLSGFDEPASEQTDRLDADDDTTPDWLELGGSVGTAFSVNFAHDAPGQDEADFRDLSMLRTTVALDSELTFGGWQIKISGHGFYDAAYSIQGRKQYTGALLNLYEQELEFDDAYLIGSLTPSLDIKTGRQVVVWGKSDNVRVTDILNPLDNRLPGMVDIKNRRLPVTMTKLDYYTGAWNLSGIMIHEVRFDKNPVFNSDFFPGKGPLPSENTPGFSIDNQQYALALNGIFSGWDLSLYGAWIFDARAHVTWDAN
ncbi:MAG: hypothetical protein GQ559_07525, partial [Desulfobulbaceae bacterium]|nr:hypothetical protein [Desulfobulbaceae bacterium]